VVRNAAAMSSPPSKARQFSKRPKQKASRPDIAGSVYSAVPATALLGFSQERFDFQQETAQTRNVTMVKLLFDEGG
jgi:hypothetical protein